MVDIVAVNERVLCAQSRSFAIPIMNLNAPFRNAVMAQYNLNKTLDSIEDNPGLSLQEKQELMHTFCNTLKGGRLSTAVLEKLLAVTSPEDAPVFRYHEEIMQLFESLPPAQQTLGREWTEEMAVGMIEYQNRGITTAADLNRYCYYVAGTVGHYLTDLLILEDETITGAAEQVLHQGSQGLALFLQKLNVIRDYYEDKHKRGATFWPQSYFQKTSDPREVLNLLCQETLECDVPQALHYQQNIPLKHESFHHFVRFILSSGMVYLGLLFDNPDIFSEHKIKLSREWITTLYQEQAKKSRQEFTEYCQFLYRKLMQQFAQTQGVYDVV